MTRPPPHATLFPYTTLFRSFQRPVAEAGKAVLTEEEQKALEEQLKKKQEENIATNEHFSYNALWFASDQGDRKSTRLNSSHRCISYAVFCLKKKKKKKTKKN